MLRIPNVSEGLIIKLVKEFVVVSFRSKEITDIVIGFIFLWLHFQGRFHCFFTFYSKGLMGEICTSRRNVDNVLCCMDGPTCTCTFCLANSEGILEERLLAYKTYCKSLKSCSPWMISHYLLYDLNSKNLVLTFYSGVMNMNTLQMKCGIHNA